MKKIFSVVLTLAITAILGLGTVGCSKKDTPKTDPNAPKVDAPKTDPNAPKVDTPAK